MKMRFILVVVVCALVLTGCDQLTNPDTGDGGSGDTVSKPTINSFTASSATITRGNSTTLQWSTSGASTVEINRGIGEVAKSGSMQISPTDDETYRMTARNSAGYVYKECSVVVENGANVVMVSGPRYSDEGWYFEYYGRVKNKGQWAARFVKVYLYIFNSNGKEIDREYGYADDTDLRPGEASPWDVSFFDDSVMKNIDKSKTEYEIEWSEYGLVVSSGRRKLNER